MAKYNYLHIGTRSSWNVSDIGFNVGDAFQHLLINGATGTGKTVVLKSLHAQILQHRHGCTLIDPNGDVSKDSLNSIPPALMDRVIYIDPSDTEHVIPFNPFYKVPLNRRAIVAENFTQACKSIWRDSWGERLDWYLQSAVHALMYAPDELQPTLLSINMILSNPHYRKKVLSHVTNPEVIRHYKTEFNRLSERERSEVIKPIENKIGKFVSNPLVRNLLSPYQPAFQFKDAIAQKKIVILRFPKGALGETSAKLMSSLAVSNILNAAYEQESIPEEHRIPHFLCIDEKHAIPTEALITAYPDLRKYKLALIIATQYTDQMPDAEVKAMISNVENIIALRSSAIDAERFRKKMRHVPEDVYTTQVRGTAVVRLMRHGNPGQTLNDVKIDKDHEHVQTYNRAQLIQEYVRQTYARPRAEVEAAYMRWFRKELIEPEERARQRKAALKKRKLARKVVLAHQPTDDGSITDRGEEAKAAIRKIVDATVKKHPATQAKYPVFKVPTRRRRRRPKQA